MKKIILLFIGIVTLGVSLFVYLNEFSPKDIDEKIKQLIEKGKYIEAASLMNNYDLDSQTRLNIAWIYAFNDKNSEAVAIVNELLLKDSSFQEAYYLKGYVNQSISKYNEAIKSYKKAIELNPKDIKSYGAIAEIYQILEKTNDSVYYYRQALKLEPDNYIYYLELANIYFKKGDFKASLKEAQQAYTYSPASDKEKIKETLENIKLNAIVGKAG